MLKRDPNNPRNIILQQKPSKMAEKLVLMENYIADNVTGAIDTAVDKLAMDSNDVEKAVEILTAIFDLSTTNVATKDVHWLIERKLAEAVGIVITPEGKKVMYSFTTKGRQFFAIMFGSGNSPRVVKRRVVDGYALVKYAILEECLI